MSLEADGIVVALGGAPVLDGVSLAFEPGRMSVVVGPNGAGKTTLMRALAGDLAPQAGEVRLDGRPLADWRGMALAARRAVLPQASHLAFPFTVYEVVAMGLGATAPGGRAAHRVLAALDRVGLEGYEGRFYQTLSGGEQQRVQLARVLCQIDRPAPDGGRRWLLLDEPTSNLDIRHQLAILDIARAHARAGDGVIAILHDLNMASLYADRLIVVSNGAVAGDGAPESVLTDALVAEVFGVALRVNLAPPGGPPFVLPHSAGHR